MNRNAAEMPADTAAGSRPGLGRIGPRRRHWHRLLALLLGAAVFVVDTFTDVTGAIAVLYVLVMLLASDAFSRRGLILLTLACAGLAILSFFLSHGDEADVSAVIRCGISLAAIGITTVLLLRDQTSKQSLVAANTALARSETRYRSIFEQVRVALWEQDFSEVRAMLARLRQQGVRDVAAYAREHPAFARDCARRIRTIHVNDATAELLRLLYPLYRAEPSTA